MQKENQFSYWKQDSPALSGIIKHMESLTTEGSSDYVPHEQRLAVFDMDGTLISECLPFCFMFDFFKWWVLGDGRERIEKSHDEQAKKFIPLANRIKGFDGDFSEVAEVGFPVCTWYYKAFEGMTIAEYSQFVNKFLNETNTYYNKKPKDLYYKPMQQLISYLQSKEFEVFVITGSDRIFARMVLCDTFNLRPRNIIGHDPVLKVSDDEFRPSYLQTITSANDKFQIAFDERDKSNFIVNNVKIETLIAQVGEIPQISIGNSRSDLALLDYCRYRNKGCYTALLNQDDKNQEIYYNKESVEDNWKIAKDKNVNLITTTNDFKSLFV